MMASAAESRSAPKVGDSTQFVSKDGAFVRRDSEFRDIIGASDDLPAVAGRYHLFASFACPWASRTLMARVLKGLQDVITVDIVHPVWSHTKPDVDEHRGTWRHRIPWLERPALTHLGGQVGPSGRTLRAQQETA